MKSCFGQAEMCCVLPASDDGRIACIRVAFTKSNDTFLTNYKRIIETVWATREQLKAGWH